MNRIVLGGLIALALTGLGLFWWQGRAEVERGAPPPQPASRQQAIMSLCEDVIEAFCGSWRGGATE